MHLRFVSAEGGSAFMHELLEVVADAVGAESDANATVHIGGYPKDDDGAVYVVIPHEYFVLTPSTGHPSPAQMQRTIAFCVEHPGNATFEVTADWAGRVGATMDINRDSTEELQRMGIPAQRFVLGYSPRWDVWHGDTHTARTVDITYMGTTDIRRDHLLGRQARHLSEWRTALLIPPHEQMTGRRPDFLVGSDKYRHLANSRVLVNLHRGASRSLEWVRVLEAMCNGCVVVSEQSIDFEPLIAGTHIAFSRPEAAAAVATALLRHPDRLETIRHEAYTFCRDELSMRASALRLLEIAHDLPERGSHRGGKGRSAQDSMPAASPSMPEPPQPDPETAGLTTWTEPLPRTTREAVAGVLADAVRRTPIVINEQAFAHAWTKEHLDVVIAADGECAALATTLRSLAIQDVATRVLIATPNEASPELDIPRARMRNELINRTLGDAVLVVDPGIELFPGALHKLLLALRTSPDACGVYPMVADRQSGRLWNALPVEGPRLERRNYLGAPVLLRREILRAVGGYNEDGAMCGFEDHELWIRLVRLGHSGALVPEILATGRRPRLPDFGIASLVPERTRAVMTPEQFPCR